MTTRESTGVPLCVDLDGTLIRTDLLLESFLAHLKIKPWVIFLLPLWIVRGKAYLKERIAREVEIDTTVLPYCTTLLTDLRHARANGQLLVLATASHEKYAKGISDHLGLFHDVMATSGSLNLAGSGKAERLTERFGKGGFDYVGNSTADLKIWPQARQVIVVNPEFGVLGMVRKLFPSARVIEDRKPILRTLVRALRLHQWLKNILVFVPLVAAHKIGDVSALIEVIAAFLAFGFCASSVYVVNDLLDLESDRHHPRKRKRPFASGELSILTGIVLVPLLLGTAIAISLLWLPGNFLIGLGTYYAVTTIYSFWAKNRVVVDVLFLAGLYTMRILAGAAAIAVLPSFWLLAFSMFIFLSLALVKRYSELLSVLKAGQGKARGRGYFVEDLPVLQSLGASSGFLAVLVLALYINSPEVHAQYANPMALWSLCPMLLFWISRVWFKTQRGEIHEDPVVFAAKDMVSLLVALICGVALVVAA